MGQRPSNLRLLHAEPPKALKRFRLEVGLVKRDCSSIDRAVGMSDAKAGRRTPLDEKEASVHGPVMVAAKKTEVIRVIRTAFTKRIDVMGIKEYRASAPRNDALAPVTTKNSTPNRWRNLLACAPLTRTHVGSPTIRTHVGSSMIRTHVGSPMFRTHVGSPKFRAHVGSPVGPRALLRSDSFGIL